MAAPAELMELFFDEIAERVAAKLRAVPQLALAEPLPNDGEPVLVNKTEAARAIGVSTVTLDRAVRMGCPVHHFNGRRRFDVAAVKKWLETEKSKTAAARKEHDPIKVDHLTRALGYRKTK